MLAVLPLSPAADDATGPVATETMVAHDAVRPAPVDPGGQDDPGQHRPHGPVARPDQEDG